MVENTHTLEWLNKDDPSTSPTTIQELPVVMADTPGNKIPPTTPKTIHRFPTHFMRWIMIIGIFGMVYNYAVPSVTHNPSETAALTGGNTPIASEIVTLFFETHEFIIVLLIIIVIAMLFLTRHS